MEALPQKGRIRRIWEKKSEKLFVGNLPFLTKQPQCLFPSMRVYIFFVCFSLHGLKVEYHCNRTDTTVEDSRGATWQLDDVGRDQVGEADALRLAKKHLDTDGKCESERFTWTCFDPKVFA